MSTIEQRAAKLRERTQTDYPDTWDFKEIPNVTGIVESIRLVKGSLGERVVVQILEVEGPEAARKRWSIWLSQKALYSQFAELRVAVGELVSATYLGVSDHAEPGQSPAHRFRVEVDRAGQQFQWPGSTSSAAPESDDVTGPEAREAHETVVDAAAAAGATAEPTDDDIPF